MNNRGLYQYFLMLVAFAIILPGFIVAAEVGESSEPAPAHSAEARAACLNAMLGRVQLPAALQQARRAQGSAGYDLTAARAIYHGLFQSFPQVFSVSERSVNGQIDKHQLAAANHYSNLEGWNSTLQEFQNRARLEAAAKRDGKNPQDLPGRSLALQRRIALQGMAGAEAENSSAAVGKTTLLAGLILEAEGRNPEALIYFNKVLEMAPHLSGNLQLQSDITTVANRQIKKISAEIVPKVLNAAVDANLSSRGAEKPTDDALQNLEGHFDLLRQP